MVLNTVPLAQDSKELFLHINAILLKAGQINLMVSYGEEAFETTRYQELLRISIDYLSKMVINDD